MSALPFTAERFVLGRRLGSGGAGVVYEAFDHERNERVALKRLRYADPTAIYNFKREFRAVADVAHPNLVTLYELIGEASDWFFTMELIDGVPFSEHVRPSHGSGSVLDVQRLRSALQQLIDGVYALHVNGLVHRDLKPSNVLVTPNGRVVILDFGIMRAFEKDTFQATMDSIVGTIDYMAPEQAAGEANTSASDWYSVGVMLYEALTGRLPFEGPLLGVMYDKQMRDPTSPELLAGGLPPDLVHLCLALLARDPNARPNDFAAFIATRGHADVPDVEIAGTAQNESFIGRETQLQALRNAFDSTTQTRTPCVAYVYGPSGIGKTSVAEHFLSSVVREDRAIVLTGRCYDRESMPYKALDGAIDSLSRYLHRLDDAEVKNMLPRDVHAIATMFPVLRRVEAIQQAPTTVAAIPNLLEVRRRAIAALRELFSSIAHRHAVVIHVDDVQWADEDSLAVAADILRGPDAPPILLIVSFRSEEIPQKAFLREMISRPLSRKIRQIPVGPLSQGEARALAWSTLAGVPGADAAISKVVEEAQGSPFLLEQLAGYVRENPSAAATASLEEVVDSRLERLPPGCERVLHVLSLARRPIDFEVAVAVAGVAGQPRALSAAMRAARLIRASGSSEDIEIYHDHLAEAVRRGLSDEEARAMHLKLSETLLESAADDPEALFEHLYAAGEQERAAGFAVKAARKAAAALAFDRAARFYRRALELQDAGGAAHCALSVALGESLVNAGKPGQAAEAFLDAAGSAPTRLAALQYRRRAAEQLLVGGHNDRGLAEMETVLNAVQLRMPGTATALIRLLFLRLRLRLRGLDYRIAQSSDVPEIDLLRMDICWGCAIGLTMVDYIVAAYFQSRYLLLAVEAGEPYHLSRALAFESGFLAARGVGSERRSRNVLLEAQALAERLGSPRELGLAAVTAGSAACMVGDFPRAVTLCAQAEQILRNCSTGVLWELTTCDVFMLTSLYYSGDVREIVRRVPASLNAARDSGNLFASTELRTRQNVYWLIQDDPGTAHDEVVAAMERWSRSGFYRQHYNALLAHVQIELYRGAGPEAWQRIETTWPVLSRSMLLRVQLLRCESRHLRARSALAAAAASADPEPLLREAERMAKRLAREGVPWADPFVPLVRAGIANIRGDTDASVSLLRRAAAGFDAGHMRLYAAAARRQLGTLIGSTQGTRMVADADAFMTEQSIANVSRFTRMLVPGFQ